MSLKKTKAELREEARKLITELVSDKVDFFRRQEKLIQKIESLDEFKKAQIILTYNPFNYEFNLTSLIDLYPEKVWALPKPLGEGIMELREVKNLKDSLEEGRYQLKVPNDKCKLINPQDLDLALLPGLAFDRDGYRLGQGAGYYDRILTKISDHCVTIGIACEEQIWDSIPVDDHDIPVNKLILS